jgi:hypothetical protein
MYKILNDRFVVVNSNELHTSVIILSALHQPAGNIPQTALKFTVFPLKLADESQNYNIQPLTRTAESN